MTTGKQALNNPLKVIVLSPPIDKSGGIGTLYRYAREQFTDQVDVEFIDTRGYSKNPWLSALTLVRALALITLRRITGDVDVIHINLGARGAAVRKLTLAAWIRYVLRVPYVLHLHAPTFGDFVSSLPRIMQRLIVHLLNQSEALLVLGEVWREAMHALGCSPDVVRVFVMGVPDIQAKKHKVEFDPSSTDPYYYILFAGAIGERKGLPQVLEALATPENASVRAIIAGDGDVGYWKNVARNLGVLERAAFLGLVDPDLIHQILNDADALILPSRAEGLPVSVLESLSAGKLTICSPAGSLTEFIEDGKEAIILADRSSETVAAALQRAVIMKSDSSIEANARAVWKQYFDSQVTTQNLIQIWLEVAPAKP